jgi:hypothetical protein
MKHRNPRRERRAKEAQYRKERKKAHTKVLRGIPKFPTPKKQPTKVQMQKDLKARFEAGQEEKRQLEKALARIKSELAAAQKRIQSMQLAQGAIARVA